MRLLLLALAAAMIVACTQPARLVRSDAERVLTGVTLNAPNPSDSGPHRVGYFTYGSGTDKRRAAYRDSVRVRTRSVNGIPFLRGLDDKAAKKRWKYWGFTAGRLPVNGRVWYPEGEGSFPLVLIVHGNHGMKEYSDPGYEYLGRHLASRGFIAVSVDENFLNGAIREENDARGWMLLKHLEAWRGIATDSASPVRGRVDLSRIALIGHSRGGEAVVVAAAFNRLAHYPDDARIRFDFNFPITSLIAIAPIDGQYRPADRLPPVRGVHYFVIHGSHDADVSVFAGQRTYLRADVSDSGLVKAALYVYRANHGQFNTVWGDNDIGDAGWMLNRRTLISGDEQRKIGLVFFTGFLEMTVNNRREYEPMFRDHRTVGAWLPPTMYISSYADWRVRTVADFEEDIDVTTARGGARVTTNGLSAWRERALRGRAWGNQPFETNTAVLGWRAQTDSTADSLRAWYRVALTPAQVAGLTTQDALRFGIVDLGQRPSALSPADTATPPAADTAATRRRRARAAQERTGRAADSTRTDSARADSTRAARPQESARARARREKREEEARRELPADSLRVDLSVEIELADGRRAALPLSAVAALRPPLTIRLLKFGGVERRIQGNPRDHEHVLQHVEIPLERFAALLPGFAATEIRAVRFRFDRTPAGTVALDDVGFRLFDSMMRIGTR